MHPNRAFRAEDEDWLAMADARGLAHIFAATGEGPMVVHAPVSRFGSALRFHVSRGNRITPHLDGAAVLISLIEVDGYASPNWYPVPGDQVPTWNYVGAEFDGVARRIGPTELTEQLDALAACHEPRVSPDNPWTRAKMDDGYFRRLLEAIVGFEVEVTAIRGTRKLSQNKSAADRAGLIAGLERSGDIALAAAMQGVDFAPASGEPAWR